MAWNGFCARCGRLVSRLTIDTVNLEGERRTVLLCEKCWVSIRHPERLIKPKEPTTIVCNTAVTEEKHTIQKPGDDGYEKVEGHIGEVKSKTPDYVESVEEVKKE